MTKRTSMVMKTFKVMMKATDEDADGFYEVVVAGFSVTLSTSKKKKPATAENSRLNELPFQ